MFVTYLNKGNNISLMNRESFDVTINLNPGCLTCVGIFCLHFLGLQRVFTSQPSNNEIKGELTRAKLFSKMVVKKTRAVLASQRALHEGNLYEKSLNEKTFLHLGVKNK